MKTVSVSGAKNAATRLLAAALISDERVTLQNFPTELVDARHKQRFIEASGGRADFDSAEETAEIDGSNLSDRLLESYDYPIRTTYLLVPGLLKRLGVARIPYPGGCRIGIRRYDLHVMVWERMGAEVLETKDFIEVRARRLKGAEISFPISTIGGTESALICGAIAEGETIVHNAYISPEISNLIEFLRSMGVGIEVYGNSFVRIQGRPFLRGTTLRVIPDRIEALTWIVFGALANRPLRVDNVPFADMEVPLIHLREAGIDFFRNSSSVFVSPDCIPNGLQPFELACGTHPGVISDMQPFFVLLALGAEGISRIYDYRYPERTRYLEELAKFTGGGLTWQNGKISVEGPRRFAPAEADSADLRGSMAVVLAALLAGNDGKSVVHNVGMALRGYNKLAVKLEQLGYRMEVVGDEAHI
jgi:UDP-N-acetylglucosamine 1-carboxyvinyltransferase